MSQPYQKWRDEQVLFLDDGFDCDDNYQTLVDGGYAPQRFSGHFVDDKGSRQQGVEDDQIIKLCNRNGWLLVTCDSEIIRMHLAVIKTCKHLGILATSHNKERDIAVSARSLVKLKPVIERNNFRKRQRPWYGQFDRNGKITIMKTF